MVFEIIYFLLIGLTAGLLGGLFGIGGGFIFIPAQLFIYHYLGIPNDLQIRIAIETSLAAVVFNTLVSSYSHHNRGGIYFPIVKKIIIGIILGSLLGAFLTKIAPSHLLEIIFGIFECFIGFYFFFSPPVHESHSIKNVNLFIINMLGVVIGTLSILLGIGGGFFMVPLLIFLHLPLKQAIGSSSLITLVVSFFGATALLLPTLKEVTVPFAVGYLYIPAFVALSIGAIFGAPFGAKLTHTLPIGLLKKVFGLLLLILGLVILLK